jgi:hypothetical protein
MIMQVSGPLRRILQVRFQDADAGQVAVAFRKIQTVTHDKLVGDVETDEIGIEIDFPAPLFVQQYAYLQTGGLQLFDHAGNHRQSLASIENVIDQQDMTLGYVQGQAVHELGCADGLGLVTVTRDADAIQADRVLNFPQQVGGEEDGAIDNRNHGEFIITVNYLQLLAEFPDTAFDLGFSDQDAFKIWVAGGNFGCRHTGNTETKPGHRGNALHLRFTG